jgi:hypothetical protein
MAMKLTVLTAERIISGTCQKSQTRGADGKPDFGSAGTNDGHEAEARVGLEIDLNAALLADPAALVAAIKGYQDLVLGAVRGQLAQMSESVPKLAAQPAPLAKWGGAAPTPTTAPTATTRKAAAPVEPEDESQEAPDEEEGPPPTTGRQLFGWAAKIPGGGGKDLVYEVWRAGKYRGKVMDASPDAILKAYNACKARLAKGGA